ncbi:MAG: hypothetical protein GTO62_14540, partial [Planctomycetales bacterium]|nr:hypothetical protein [Planctomycetales bacterium]NIP70455.1 hypothetical protein [Planctomycetales bacterium]
DPAEQQKHQEEAAKIASEMVKDASGEWQSRARELLVELGKPIEAPQELPPETFADAVSQANGAMRQRGLLKTQLEKVADDQKGEIQTKVDEQTERAFQLYRLAIALADKDTPTAQLALVYKAICYLFWDRGEHLYAAVVGDFLARQFPKDDNGKFGSWIAFNAWLVEYGKVGKDRSYEIEQLQRYGENIIKRWPDSSESVTARLQLMAFAIQDGAVDQALEYLAAIPEDNPNRGQAELTVGQALWRKYARLRRLPADEQPDPAEVDQLLSQAEKVLKEGLQRLEGGGKVDANLVGAAYSLAQLYAGTNQPVEAIALYEHPLYGPLTLVQKNDPVAVEGDYALRTYRLALRTYISALPSFQGDTAQQSAMVDKAMQMVEALEKAVEDPQNTDGTSGSGAETLTRIYIEMGSELEDQIKALVDKGDLQGRDALSKAFETFLDKIRNRETGNTYQSLIWIAETFYGLGNSNTPEPGQPTPAAQEYFRRAAETYQNILDQAEADPNFLKNPRQRTTIEMRLARCYRSLGKLQETLDRLEAILKRKTTNLPVQIEAAETLFEGGKSDCENYKNAYFGVRPGKDRKNIIWGWRRLSDITRGHEKFEQVYLLSVLYGIRCRMDLAICEGAAKPEQKTELLNAALGSLVAMHRQNPQLGGEEMRSEYDRIARKLQKELGQNEAGLEAFAQPGGPSLDDETEAEKETE